MTVPNPIDDNDVPAVLAEATMAALDAACDLFDAADLSGLPLAIQQGIALTYAGRDACRDLLESMGLAVADPMFPGGAA